MDLQSTTVSVATPSAQSLHLRMFFDDCELGCGTGFIARTNAEGIRGLVLITNRHNLSGRRSDNNQPIDEKTGAIPNRVLITHHKRDQPFHWIEIFEPLLGDDNSPLWLEHPTLGREADIAALPLTRVKEIQLFPYELTEFGDVVSVSPADPVSVIGFPFGIRSGGSFAVWATGFIATEIEIDHDGLPIFLVDCRARSGQSGSPFIVHRKRGTQFPLDNGFYGWVQQDFARLLGIYAGRINERSDLGIVWKVSAIRQLIDAIKSV